MKVKTLLLIVLAALALVILPFFKQLPSFKFSFADASLHGPAGIAVDGTGQIFVADSKNGRVVVFNQQGIMTREFGSQQLSDPNDLVAYGDHIYVADFGGQRVCIFTKGGDYRKSLSGQEWGIGSINPTAIAVDRDSGFIYVADAAGHRVVVADGEGKFQFTFGLPGGGAGELLYPNGIAIDTSGSIYVADSGNGRVQVFSPGGDHVLSEIRGGRKKQDRLALPRDLALDAEGNLFIADPLSHTVHVFRGAKKKYSLRFFGPANAGLYFPAGVAVDEGGNVYITEQSVNRVSVFALPR